MSKSKIPGLGDIGAALERIAVLQRDRLDPAALDQIITTQENYIGGDT